MCKSQVAMSNVWTKMVSSTLKIRQMALPEMFILSILKILIIQIRSWPIEMRILYGDFRFILNLTQLMYKPKLKALQIAIKT